MRQVLKTETSKEFGTILYVERVTVSFDGFKALNHLNFVMDRGELRVVIGPNGAGKSTFLDVVTGKVRPEEGGKIIFGDDTDLIGLREEEIVRVGIGRKFQTPTVFLEHTLFENLELSLKMEKGVLKTLFAALTRTQKEKIEEILKLIGLSSLTNEKAGLLSHGQKQWLEIGMLIAQDPQLLLVDEPVAGMTYEERHKTAELLVKIAENHSVLVIEHDMEFVRKIARRVTVLHEGAVLCEGTMDKVQNDPKVIEVYLGREGDASA